MFDEDEEINEQEQRNSIIIRDRVINYFCKIWNVDDLKELITSAKFVRPHCVLLLSHFTNIKRIELTNEQKLAHILYEILGSKFLRNKSFLELILITIEEKFPEKWNHILKHTQNYFQNKSIETPEDIVSYDRNLKWMSHLARLLDLPESCAIKEKNISPPSSEEITSISRLPPLYDFQYALSREIKKILENKVDEKHAIIAVPTGGGKTRLMVETIVDWLNDEGFVKNFIFWIAQSEELCEQAINTFKEVFQDKGRIEKLTIHRFFKINNKLPSPYDKGIIIANISMLNANINYLDEFAARASLIVIDEVHRSTSKMYRKFYKKMGIDFRLNRSKKIPENKHGIALIGLSATPFRGNYYDPDEDPDESHETETERLHRFYHDNIMLPKIPDAELKDAYNKVPHAIIEVERETYQNSWIRISGSRSYDEDGQIIEHKWQFYNQDGVKIDSRKGETISYSFDKPGLYKIILTVKDDEHSEASRKVDVEVLPEIKNERLKIKENMKLIYKNLVMKQILSNVHQRIIKLEDDQNIDFENDKINLKKYKIDFTDSILAKIGENKIRNIKIIEEIKKLITEDCKSILVFGATKNHAQDLSIILNSIGIDSRYVIGEMENFDRIDAIKKFKKQEIKVLCNYGVLTQGFDAPLIDAVIIARPTLSHLLYNQMVGRGLRGPKNGGTQKCILVDFEDNILKRTLKEIGIENDLVWESFTSLWRSSDESSEDVSGSTLINDVSPINYSDFESQLRKIFIECPYCNLTTATGYQEIKNKFGFTASKVSESNIYGIQTWCIQCRNKRLEIKRRGTELAPQIPKKTFNELMTFANVEMEMKTNYVPLILINLLENGPMAKTQIAQLLAKGNDSENVSDYADIPVYDFLLSENIIAFDNERYRYGINAELEFKEKHDLIHAFKEKLNSFIISTTKSLKLKTIEYYEKFIGEYGHPPTTRIFERSDAPVGIDFFVKNYQSYENFQREQGIDIFGNTALREKLFDQFFYAISLSTNHDNQIPSLDEINKFGEFTSEDYRECFGNYNSFFNVVDPILDKLKIIQPLEINEITYDYFEIRKKINHTPNFDEVRLKSDIGIEHYIKKFGSYGKFKDEFTIEDELIMADKKLKIEFYNLKNKLNDIPTYDMFKQHSNSKHDNLITQLYGSYKNFLKTINCD